MAPDSIWEIVFLMVILKIPIVYLCWVVWWAIKAEPHPQEGAPVTASLPDEPDEPRGGSRRLTPPRRLDPGSRGGPVRTYPRSPLAAPAGRAKLDRR